MKKLKIMLLSLAIFAVVGGALAFKAKFTTAYCTTDPVLGSCVGLACDDITIQTTTDQTGGVFQCYTTVGTGLNKCANNCLAQSRSFTFD